MKEEISNTYDPYTYEDTDILINKKGIKNQEKLNEFERGIVLVRTNELRKKLSQDEKIKFNFSFLKSIHKYIFQDLYDWAGEVRTVNIAKNQLFCTVENIENSAGKIFSKLARSHYLEYESENKKVFVRELAELYLDINALYPFREGNGRAQREFITQLAKYNGYEMSFENFSKKEIIELSSSTNVPIKLIEKFNESLILTDNKANKIIDNILSNFNLDDPIEKEKFLYEINNLILNNAFFKEEKEKLLKSIEILTNECIFKEVLSFLDKLENQELEEEKSKKKDREIEL